MFNDIGWTAANCLLSIVTPELLTTVFQQSNLNQSEEDDYKEIEQKDDYFASNFDSDSWENNDEELKEDMVENLCLLLHIAPTVQIDQYGSLRTWIYDASNKKYWCQLVDWLLHPLTPLPDQPADWGTLLSWQACRAAAGHPPTGDIPNSNNKTTTDKDKGQPRALPQPHPQTPQHSPAAETPYKPKRWLNNPTFCSMVSWSMSHLLKILGLGLGASEMEIIVH